MTNRCKFNITVEVDLDIVPGMFHQSEDWKLVFTQALMQNAHYNPVVDIEEVHDD